MDLGRRTVEPKTPIRVLAAIPDLFFGSKVSGAARGLGVEVRFASTRQALVDGARSQPDLVIVDLDAQQVDPLGAIREIRSTKGLRVVAFASHVHVRRMERARDAGCDEVLSRASLAKNLPTLLGSL